MAVSMHRHAVFAGAATATLSSSHDYPLSLRRRNVVPGHSLAFPKISFLLSSQLILSNLSLITTTPRRKSFCRCDTSRSYDHIPKQFQEENLKDGLMENYKDVPRHLYGLSTSQLDMFMTEDNPVRRQQEKVTEESISSSRNYLENGGMWSLAGVKEGPSKYSMSVSMYRGGARGYGRPRSAPPDLPSLLLDARICYLGMPIVPAVTELIVAQLMWLDYDSPSKPIYLYINSSGTQNEKMENVGSETEAYAIADTMAYCKSKVYTVNCGMAYGQAAMLLSLGSKGFRALQPNSSTKLYLPKVNRSSGAVIDMWIKGLEIDYKREGGARAPDRQRLEEKILLFFGRPAVSPIRHLLLPSSALLPCFYRPGAGSSLHSRSRRRRQLLLRLDLRSLRCFTEPIAGPIPLPRSRRRRQRLLRLGLRLLRCFPDLVLASPPPFEPGVDCGSSSAWNTATASP